MRKLALVLFLVLSNVTFASDAIDGSFNQDTGVGQVQVAQSANTQVVTESAISESMGLCFYSASDCSIQALRSCPVRRNEIHWQCINGTQHCGGNAALWQLICVK